MSGPRFDPTINLGHIITLSCVVVSIVGGWYSLSTRMDAVERLVTEARRDVSGLAAVVVEAARVDERMKALERRVDRAEPR